MSRQFKFRALHIQLKIMMDFNFDQLAVEEGCLGGIRIDDKNWIKMQYLGTDCKDETGKEICEGDIVEVAFDTPYSDKIITAVVKLKFGEFGFFDIKDTDEDGFYSILLNMEMSKIIGNIYENPELLQVTQ